MGLTAEHASHPTPSAQPGGRSDVDATNGIEVCPFLRSRDGGWSSAFASRDLRCWAISPPAQLALPKQRELCVVGAHLGCATYTAAMAADGGPSTRLESGGISLWPAASPVPVALEPAHNWTVGTRSSPRAGGQAILVGLMVVALVFLVVARTAPLGGGGTSPGASADASLPAGVVASSAGPSPVPTAPPTVSPSPSASLAPSPTPAPSAAQRTYKVKANDTIAGIAAKYHTTVKAIVATNHIVDARTIHPGQVLVIP